MSGHEFLSRLNSRNRSGVNRALSTPNLTGGSPPGMLWAIIEAPTAVADPALPAILHANQSRVLVDTQPWRCTDDRTWQVPRWPELPRVPDRAFDGSDAWITDYVRRDLELHCRLGADAYLIPSWFTERSEDPLRPMKTAFAAAATALADVAGRPFIAGVSLRADQLTGSTERIIASIDLAASAARICITPLRPMRDGVRKLEALCRLLLGIQGRGIQTIAAAGGAAGVALRGLGASVAEWRLGDAETFDVASTPRSSAAAARPQRSGPRPGQPMYIAEIHRSLAGKLWLAIAGVRTALAAVTCTRRCHHWTAAAA